MMSEAEAECLCAGANSEAAGSRSGQVGRETTRPRVQAFDGYRAANARRDVRPENRWLYSETVRKD
jgi:hypothetical protein